MSHIRAIIVDLEWFQIYDNNNKVTEDYVASGMYWNYFYNVWKTVSYSPFSNIVYFVTSTEAEPQATIPIIFSSIEEYDDGKIITFEAKEGLPQIEYKFKQTEALTKAGVAVHPYGAYIVPNGALTDALPVEMSYNFYGTIYNYTGSLPLNQIPEIGSTVTMTLV